MSTSSRAAARLDKARIREILKAHEDEIRRLGVRRLALFGSYVTAAQGPDSDVDFLVEFVPGRKSYDHFLALARLLEELLERRVDLVTTEALSPHLGPAILATAEDALAA